MSRPEDSLPPDLFYNDLATQVFGLFANDRGRAFRYVSLLTGLGRRFDFHVAVVEQARKGIRHVIPDVLDLRQSRLPAVLEQPERGTQLLAPGGDRGLVHGAALGGGGAGWAGEPGRIIELEKPYAFAREQGLPLPSGLIAHRPAGKSRDAQKVGAFQFTARNQLGESQGLLVVMSVEEQQTAELIWSVKGRFNPQTQKMEQGAIWRFVTGRISGDKIEFVPRDGAPRNIFDWRDANSGSYSTLFDQQLSMGKGPTNFSSRFTRLD